MDNNTASTSHNAYESAQSVSIDMEGVKVDSDESASSAPLPKVRAGQPIVGKTNSQTDQKPTLGSSNSMTGARTSGGNLLTSFLTRQRSTPANSATAVNRRVQQSRSVGPPGNGEDPAAGSSSWRLHLNEMFSVSNPPSNEALLSMIQRSNMRYQSLAARGENPEAGANPSNAESTNLREGDAEQAQPNNSSTHPSTSPTFPTNPFHDEGASPSAPSPGGGDSNANDSNHDQHDAQDDRDAVWFLTKIWPYLPILVLLLLKFFYDHFMGIFNIVVLQFVMLVLNESVRREMLKFIREGIGKLITLFVLCGIVIAICLSLAEAEPDPWGLIMPPPMRYESSQQFTSALKSEFNVYEKHNEPGENLKDTTFENKNDAVSNPYMADATQVLKQPEDGQVKEVSVTYKETVENNNGAHDGETTAIEEKFDEKFDTSNDKPDKTPEFSNQVGIKHLDPMTRVQVPLGTMLFYIAISDLLIRIITICIKCLVTMVLRKSVRKKRLLRIFVFIEYVSQFYRCFTPYTQWMLYLYGSYTKEEDITRIAFCSLYTFIKFSEVLQRGVSLKKATQSVLSKIDPERTPTKEELDAAGTDCPICHDTYSSPIIVECGHIFCEDCVQTWFTREQTCPMCRAKVNEDPAYQDGGTTYTFQLY